MKSSGLLTLAGLGLSGLIAAAALSGASAQGPAPADPHDSPAARIAASKQPGPAKLVPGGAALSGVRRDEVRVVRPGEQIDEGDLVVDERGRVTVAAVRRRGESEEIIVLRTRTPEGRFAPTEVVSPPAREGQRAWHPRLATGPKGAVWLTWCGIGSAERGVHRREVYLRRIAPGRARPRLTVSTGLKAADDRHCDPVITVDAEGGPVVAWEAGGRIALRRFAASGKARGPAAFVSDGPLDRRPALLIANQRLHLAWDRYRDQVDPTSKDPDYGLFFRVSGAEGGALGPPREAGHSLDVSAAPTLALGPEERVLLLFHQTVREGLVKRLRIRELKGESVGVARAESDLPRARPEGELQGSEFPVAVTLSTGMVVAVSRPSQGFYLHLLDASGYRPVLDLTRRGWGARGRRAAIARAPDDSVLILRRARHETILERLVFEETGTAPTFDHGGGGGMARGLGKERPEPKPPAWQPGQLVYGDVHMHSAISDGTGPPDEILARARSRGLDFAVLTDHDYVVGSRMALSEHDEISWLTDVFGRLEGFTTLHGYEWTTPPVPKGFGHRNVYFRAEPPTSVFGSKGRAPTTTDLNRLLKKEKAFTAPHHTAWTGTDWEGYRPDIQRHFEVVSAHGAFEGSYTTPIAPRGELEGYYAVDGLKEGKIFGFLGGSDGHGLLWHHGIARKADSWALGLTGVRLSEKSTPGASDRARLWDALHARHTLATSGNRMEAYLKVGELAPGDEGKARAPLPVRLRVRAGQAPVRIELVRDGEVVWKVDADESEFETEWSDATVGAGKHFYYLRAHVGESADEPEVVWTSPVFVTVEAK